MRELIEIQKDAAVRKRRIGRDLELNQPVILGLDRIQDLTVIGNHDTVGAVHVGRLLGDRAVGREVKDLAVDHRAGRGAGAREVDAPVTVGRKVVGADEGMPVLVVRVGRQILAVGGDVADRAAVIAGGEKFAARRGNDRRRAAARLGPEDAVLRTVPSGHRTAIVFDVVELAVVPDRPLGKVRIVVEDPDVGGARIGCRACQDE